MDANALLAEIAVIRAENERLRLLADQPQVHRSSKPWLAVILNGQGYEEMSKSFDRSGDADRWLILRLVKDGASDWTAELTHSLSKSRETVTRDEAFSRSVGHVTRTVTHTAAGYRRGAALSFGQKTHQTRVEFSRG